MMSSVFPKVIKLYAHVSKEQAYEAGERHGLTGEALNLFMHAGSEVKLDFEVDSYGKATLIAVESKPLPSICVRFGKAMDALRGTGRTTKMLKEAMRLALHGEAVAVVVGNQVMVKYAMDGLTALESAKGVALGWELSNVNYQVVRLSGFSGYVAVMNIDQLDIRESRELEERLQHKGRRFDHVFFDHHAIEVKFQEAIKLLHKFDPPMHLIIPKGSE